MAESPYGSYPSIEIEMPIKGAQSIGRTGVVTGNNTRVLVDGKLLLLQEMTLHVKNHEIATLELVTVMTTGKTFRLKGHLVVDECEEVE